MKLEKRTNIFIEMLTFIEMCIIPPGLPRFILLFNQMFCEANDSLINLILVGVTGFGEGWKGCMLWGPRWHWKWDNVLCCSWQDHKAWNKRTKIDQREAAVKEEQKGKETIPDTLCGRHLLQFKYLRDGSLG